MNNATTAFILIVAFGVTILLLWLANTKRNERYHQFYSVIGACVFSILVYLLYIGEVCDGIIGLLNTYVKPHLNITGKLFIDSVAPFYLFIGLLLSVFIPFKRLLIWGLKSKKLAAEPPALRTGVYEQHEERILLGGNYFYPRQYMLALAVLFSIIYCISFFSYQIEEPFPAYAILLIVCFLEGYWFLNGNDELPEVSVETVKDKPTNYLDLWREYTETWKENLGVAFTKTSVYNDWPVAELEGELLIKNYKQGKVFPKVRELITSLLNRGQTIVVFIPDNFQPLKPLEESDKYKIVTDLLFGNEFTSQYLTTDIQKLKQAATIYLTSIDKFLLEKVNIEEDVELHRWFKKMRMVIYFGYDISLVESPESSVSASSVLKYLAGSPDDFMSIVFAEDRQAQQASWKSNLKVNPQQSKEVKIDDSEPENMYYLGWKGEYRYEFGVLNNFANRYVGPVASLHLLPYCHNVRKVNIKANETRAYEENTENISIYRDDWRERYNKLLRLNEKNFKQYRQIHLHDLSLEHQDENVLFVNDKYHNAPFLYKYYAGFGKQHHLLHIVSEPHILREYFDDNFEYFSKNPIKPLSYMLINGDKFMMAMSLLEKLVKCKLSIEELAEEFIDLSSNKYTVIEQLRGLFKDAYDFDIVTSNSLKVSETIDGRFLISLSPDIKTQIELFKKVRFIDKHGSEVFLKNKNLLFQKYLIGQIHSFDGRLYKITSISHDISDDIIVRLENIETRQNFSYMEKKTIQLEGNNPWQRVEALNPTNEYSVGIYTGSFTVVTKGYYQLDDGNSLSRGRFTFHTSKDIERKERYYKYGRICKITFSDYEDILNIENAVMTIRIILKEIFKTLYPDSYHYLIVRCFGLEEAIPQNILSEYYSLTNRFEGNAPSEIGIYIFEDSIFDMGHLKSIVENMGYILKIVDDYLAYLDEKVRDKSVPVKTLDNHIVNDEDFFLSYELANIEKISDFPHPLDVLAAKNLTSRCLRLQNEITSDRWGREITRETAVKFLFFGNCSCCDKPNCNQDNAQIHQDDKRIICNDCLLNNQRSKDEEEQLVEEVRKYFENNYQFLPSDIDVIFSGLNDVRVNVKSKRRFPHAGIQVDCGNGRRTVYVENYRNYTDTFMALLHAFTHVWQIANLNTEKLKSENKDNYLDGQACLVLQEASSRSSSNSYLSRNEAKRVIDELGKIDKAYYTKAARSLKVETQKEEVFNYLIDNYPRDREVAMEQLTDY